MNIFSRKDILRGKGNSDLNSIQCLYKIDSRITKELDRELSLSPHPSEE